MNELRAMEPSDYLEQIAQLLVDSSEVPTDMQDVGDAVAIVQTVKNALDWLAKARREVGNLSAANLQMCKHLDAINVLLAESPDMPLTKNGLQVWPQTVAGVADALRYLNEARSNCVAKESEADRHNGLATEWQAKAIAVQVELNNAHRSIGQLEAAAEREKRSALRWEAESHEWQSRYEGMEAALRIALELAGVGK